ncbi:hypothetical protein ACFFRR_006979 [Megaselia abdita]
MVQTTHFKRRRISLCDKIRISLAYRELETIPRRILKNVSSEIEILDLSYNGLVDLSFLINFPKLKTLILDRNFKLDYRSFPDMFFLEILWINNCNIIDIRNWLKTLQLCAPNIKELSMMCNPVGSTVLNGVTQEEENLYRVEVIRLLPNLKLFDGVPFTGQQKKLAFQKKIWKLWF